MASAELVLYQEEFQRLDGALKKLRQEANARAIFLIDKNGVVMHQVVNMLPLGRNIDEMLRMVDALQFHEEHGEVCPAGWNRGDEGMKANAEGVSKYLAKHAAKL